MPSLEKVLFQINRYVLLSLRSVSPVLYVSVSILIILNITFVHMFKDMFSLSLIKLQLSNV